MLGQLLLGDRSHGWKQQEDTANVERCCATEAGERKRLRKEMRASIQGSLSLTIIHSRSFSPPKKEVHINSKIMDVQSNIAKVKRQIKRWYEAEDYLTNHKPVPKSKYYMEILEILILWFPTTWFWAPEFPPRHLDLTMSSCQECMDMHQDLGFNRLSSGFFLGISADLHPEILNIPSMAII